MSWSFHDSKYAIEEYRSVKNQVWEVRKEKVDEIARDLGKTPHSVISHLVSSSNYLPKGAVEGDVKQKRKSKEELVTIIAEELKIHPDVLESLKKATQLALSTIVRQIQRNKR